VPDPIRAGDPPTPLPSEILAGQNIAGFVLTPTDLDRLPVLTTYPSGDVHVSCRAIQAGEREAAEAQADALRAEITSLGEQLDACRQQQGRQAATITNQRTPAVDDDPYRPHPDSWPDDAVLLRYRELRALVALHLDRYCEPGSGRAMRDGDVPLRLAEVLDQ
jgi:hypothetical protein